MTKPIIGFIGLGLMGGNMVENLQKRGYEVAVMDLNKDAVDAVLARGNASEASSGKELAEKSDIVMLCLTTSEVVEKVVYGDTGVLAGMSEGKTLIDFGTSIPASTKKIEKLRFLLLLEVSFGKFCRIENGRGGSSIKKKVHTVTTISRTVKDLWVRHFIVNRSMSGKLFQF